MHQCEFCHDMFKPRPQVKHPRACKNCQGKRQQANEQAWHLRNRGLYDGEYHGLQKQVRRKQLQKFSAALSRCLDVGKNFLGIDFNLNGMADFFFQFLSQLGIRRANKLWHA